MLAIFNFIVDTHTLVKNIIIKIILKGSLNIKIFYITIKGLLVCFKLFAKIQFCFFAIIFSFN